ncbi:MAG: masK21, partial [Myxococcaceae bacterium]|nr:masK21 [Myxococcaceae bacterium]
PAIPQRGSVEETRAARTPERHSKRAMARVEDEVEEGSSTGAHFRANHPKWLRPLLFTAIPLVAALLTGIGVLAYGKWSTFSVQLSSSPTGALVRVDGRANTQTTPLLLTDLSADRSHELEVSAPGMLRWVQRVDPQRGATMALHVELEPDRLPDSLLEEPFDAGVAAAATEPAPIAPVAVLPIEADYPVAGFTLHAKKHAFLVPPSKAARLRLDPKKTYRVWTEGKLSFGGYFDNVFVTECVYFLEGGPGLASKDTFGLVGAKGTVVKNASALYAFVTDEKANDNTGAIKVRVMDTASHATSTVLVDAKSNSFAPEPHDRFTLQRLEPLNSYDVKLKDGRPSARTLGEKGGLARRVLLRVEPGWNNVVQSKKYANEFQRILEVGKPIRISGASALWTTLPDDGLDDNAGTLEIEVTEVPGLNGLLNNLVPKRK